MSKTLVVCGYGPGISAAVAEKFGAEGFRIALVARNKDRLAAGVSSLAAKGFKAEAFPTDLSDPASVRALIQKVRATLGPITVLQWNAYAGDAGDVLTADVASLHRVFDVAVTSLVAAIQESLPDLKQSQEGGILITNGGFGYVDPQVDAFGVQANAMGLSIANSAKRKLVGLLAEKLKGDGIYVGEVTVMGTVKGTAWDSGKGPTIDPATIADKFWQLYRARGEVRAQIS